MPGVIYFLLSFIIILVVLIMLDACRKSDPGTHSCNVQYSSGIKPIISAKCGLPGCHAPGSTLPDLTNYDVLKIYADDSIVRQNVFELKIMPPAVATPLTNQEKEKLKCWLDNGAPEN